MTIYSPDNGSTQRHMAPLRPVEAADTGADAAGRMPDAPALLTRPQLATRWQCTSGHLANLASAGLGPAYLKLSGNFVRYRLEDIVAYEQQHRVATLEAA